MSTYILIYSVRDTLYFRMNYYQIKRLSNVTLLCHPVWFPVKPILWKKYVSDRFYYEERRKRGRYMDHHINILHIKCSVSFVRNLFPDYIPLLISSFFFPDPLTNSSYWCIFALCSNHCSTCRTHHVSTLWHLNCSCFDLKWGVRGSGKAHRIRKQTDLTSIQVLYDLEQMKKSL